MSTDSSLDRASFQQLLASAFAVQESQIDSQLLSGILEVERLVGRGDLGLDGAMLLVVESARDVANADGVAIGLLEGDRLIYRAGSGCSAAQTGNRVRASLTVSSKTQANREILRVENARTDTRIEAAICRQFGAESLLILSIYHARVLTGVLEVLFGEAHTFQEREVRTYRLMAGLVETAIAKTYEIEQAELTPDIHAPRSADAQPAPEGANLVNPGDRDEEAMPTGGRRLIYQRCEAVLAAVRESPAARMATTLSQRAMGVRSHSSSLRTSLRMPSLSVAFAALATVLVLGWIAYSSRTPATPAARSAAPGSSAVMPQVSAPPGDAAAVEETSQSVPALIPTKTANPDWTKVRRTRAAQNEVEYLGDDVTVRHFAYQNAAQRSRLGQGRVSYIGDDVTVRYFTPKPALSSESQ